MWKRILGDLLSPWDTLRLFKVSPEEALSKACDKFIRRFQLVERLAHQSGQSMEDMELSGIWTSYGSRQSTT